VAGPPLRPLREEALRSSRSLQVPPSQLRRTPRLANQVLATAHNRLHAVVQPTRSAPLPRCTQSPLTHIVLFLISCISCVPGSE
jgi:hypothetical protein